MIKETAVALIIFSMEKPQKFLLLKYNIHGQTHWDFVKGRIEKKEEIEKAALRELEEETGIKSGQLKFIPNFKESCEYEYIKDNGETVHKRIIYLAIEISIKREVTLSEEHSKLGWFSFKEANSLLKFDNQKKVLNKFLQLKL